MNKQVPTIDENESIKTPKHSHKRHSIYMFIIAAVMIFNGLSFIGPSRNIAANIGFLIFSIPFILMGIALLKPRATGTKWLSSPLNKSAIIAFAVFAIYAPVSIVVSQSSKSKTNEMNVDYSVSEQVDYDTLQELFIDISLKTTPDDIMEYINNNELKYTKEDYNGNPKNTTYKIAYYDAVARQKKASNGDFIKISFDRDNGRLLFAEYSYHLSFNSALLYNYGVFWQLQEEYPGNRYSGYYYYQPGKKDGIVIKYDNGNEAKTPYQNCNDAKSALKAVLLK